MAQDGRDERIPTRRPVPRLDNASDPQLDMVSIVDSREERRLMRQRGAGNREFNNIDFGFAFATPARFSTRKSRTRSRTPSIPARTPIRSNNNEKRIPSSSVRSTRTARLPTTIAEDPENAVTSRTQRKRRRLSDTSNISRSTSLGLPAVLEDAATEEVDERQFHNIAPASEAIFEQRDQIAHRNVPSSPLFFPDPPPETFDADKENEPSIQAKKRKRKSIGQQSLFKKKKRPSASSVVSSRVTPPIEESTEHHQEQVEIWDPDSPSTEDVVAFSGPANDDSLLPPGSPPAIQPARAPPTNHTRIPNRRKKRKSITGVKKKRKSNDSASLVFRGSPVVAENVHVQDPAGGIEHGNHSDTDITQKPPTRRNIRRQRSPSMPPVTPLAMPRVDIREEEDADETYLPEEATPEPTPAPKRAQAKAATRHKSHSKDGTRSSIANRRHGKFPILTHRIANISALPTITEGVSLNFAHENDDEEIDELAGNPPAITVKSAPNAVDVLAQACRETIDISVESLKDLSTADRTRQTVALQTFRSNLDMRLFDLSQSLDQRLHLEARLRKQRREKAELQARWLEVRKRRDLMALRMDSARRQHWDNEDMSRQAWQVSQSAHRLETAMSRAETQPDQDSRAALLEYSLQELSQDVSSTDGGGILSVLRDFNAQLERTARVPG